MALTASLVLNIFFVAVIGGHIIRAHRSPVPMGVNFTKAVQDAEANLPTADAKVFKEVLHRGEPRYNPALLQLVDARAELERQIAAEPFDRAKVSQALVAWRTAWLHFTDELGGPLVDALSEISPDGRAQLIASRRANRGDVAHH